jgi:hypothetical protein
MHKSIESVLVMILREVPSLLRSMLFIALLWSAPTICISSSISGTIYLNPHLCSTWQWIELEDFSLTFLFHDNNGNSNAYESILRDSIESGLLVSLIEAAVSNDGNVTLALNKNSQKANTISNNSEVEFISVNFETLDLLNGTKNNNNENNVTVMLHGGGFNLVYPCSNSEEDTARDITTTNNPTSNNTSRALLQQSLFFLPITVTTMVMQSVQNQAYFLIDQLNLTSYSVTIVIPQLNQLLQEEDSKNETQTITSSPSPPPPNNGGLFSATNSSSSSPTAEHRITSRPWRKTTSTPTIVNSSTLVPRSTEVDSSYPVAAIGSNSSKTSEGLNNGTLFLKTTGSPSTSPVLPQMSPSKSAYSETDATANKNYTANFSTSHPFSRSPTKNPKKSTVQVKKPNYTVNSNNSKNSTTHASNRAQRSNGPIPSHNHVPTLPVRPIIVMTPQKPGIWSTKTPKANSSMEYNAANNASSTKLTSPSPYTKRTYLPTVPVIYMNETIISSTGVYGFNNNNMTRNDSSRSSENSVAISKSNAFPPIFLTGIICFIIFGVLGVAFFVKKSKASNIKTSVGPKSPLKNGSKFRHLLRKKRSMNSISSDVKKHHPFSPQFMIPSPTNRIVERASILGESTKHYKTPNGTAAINSHLNDGHRIRKSSPGPERNFQELHSDDDEESEVDLLSLHSANTTVSSFFQLDPDWDPNDASNDEDTERKGNFFVVSSHSKANRDRGNSSAERTMRRFQLPEGSSSHSLEFSSSSDDISHRSASMFRVSSSPKQNKLQCSTSTPPGSKAKVFSTEESSSGKRLARKRSDKQLQSISPKILQLRKKAQVKDSGLIGRDSSISNDAFEKMLTMSNNGVTSDDISDEWDVLNYNRFQTLSAYELDLMDQKQTADDVVFL